MFTDGYLDVTILIQMVIDYRQELEERNRQLEALNQAAIAIAGELSLDKVLQKIVDSARELVGAKYGAMGVSNADGQMEVFVYGGMTVEEAVKIAHLPRGLGLLGAIVREKRPIRVPSLEDDPRSVGFPQNHPTMVSFLGVPVLGGRQVLGNLYLTDKRGAPEFTAADQEIVEMFAVHAAVAIQNARLYEQVSRLAVVEERARIGFA